MDVYWLIYTPVTIFQFMLNSFLFVGVCVEEEGVTIEHFLFATNEVP